LRPKKTSRQVTRFSKLDSAEQLGELRNEKRFQGAIEQYAALSPLPTQQRELPAAVRFAKN